MPTSEVKPKVMLHYIMPPKTSGPNTSMERIEKSWLRGYYQFGSLVQDERPGKTLNIRLLKKMIAQVKEFQPDLIHVSGLQSAGFYALLAARLGGCRRIITAVRGSATEAIGIKKLEQLLFRYIIEPATMTMSTGVYTVCEDMAGKFGIARKGNFIGVIHNAAPIINRRDYAREEFRREIQARPEEVLIAVVGRMYYDKGIAFIIEAIQRGSHPRAKIVFVGDGPYCDIIADELKEEMQQGRVHVLGKRNDVLRILAGCDIFLFATLHENLSNALLEACSMGLAIIATAVGGNLEVITDKSNGLLIPPGDSAAIIEAVGYLCEREKERKRLGEAALVTVENEFSQSKLYARLHELYQNLLN